MSVQTEPANARKAHKHALRKKEIAKSAIVTLTKLGYARASLRDIAAECGLSLGMLHYYFKDRSDLITYCAASYKERFIINLHSDIEKADSREAVIETFSFQLANAALNDAPVHQLWYDIRNQAMFDAQFLPTVEEIEASLLGIASLAIERSNSDLTANAAALYGALDGMFFYFMNQKMRGAKLTQSSVQEAFKALLSKAL